PGPGTGREWLVGGRSRHSAARPGRRWRPAPARLELRIRFSSKSACAPQTLVKVDRTSQVYRRRPGCGLGLRDAEGQGEEQRTENDQRYGGGDQAEAAQSDGAPVLARRANAGAKHEALH